jgi:hydrogenase maturation protein HypF
LRGVADGWLLHDRPIVRHGDDSVARMIAGRPAWLRLGRGSAPLRISVPHTLPPILAVGGHLKSAVALGSGREIILGPHIGNLDTAAARRRFREVVDDLRGLHGVEPESVVCDLHPDYFTTRFADQLGLPVIAVQHHHAHIAAVLAEHGETGPVLGIAWDGTGLGLDGTIWGGEFLRVEGPCAERVGSLMPFPLVGGDRAAREPRRVAAGVRFAAGLWPPSSADFTEAEFRLLEAGFRSTQLTVKCTSAGRLFDAWAAFLGICPCSAYEAEAAIRLEACADPSDRSEFPFALVDVPKVGSIPRIDWRPWAAETLRELSRGVAPSSLSARFHNSLARGCLEMARRIGLETVVLGGGCFQNGLLTERSSALLTENGFRVLRPRRVPAGDGGLALGQIWATAAS